MRRQAEAGIDIPSDGEFGKAISWSQYALERLSGFERRPAKAGANPFSRGADRTRFAEFYAELDAADGPPATAGATGVVAVCTGAIEYTGQEELQRDIANFKAALAAAGVKQGFLPVAAPASVIPDRKNEYYKSDEECLRAIARAMRTRRSATSSGCSTMLVAWLITPGTSVLPRGSFTFSHTRHSCSWRGLAPSMR